MTRWRHLAAVIVITVASVQGLDVAVRNAPLPAPAARFLEYYETLEKTGKTGIWERLVFSWILAGDPNGQASSVD